MTDQEAQDMLKQLTEHFGERVAPVSKYCEAFKDFLRVNHVNIAKAVGGDHALHSLVYLTIGKSNLLHRLIYCGEKLRTQKCPKHEGRWSGIDFSGSCPCQLTGWLPEPE